MSRQPQRRECTVQGLRLSYLEWGTPVAGRSSLLILHGLLAAAETFDRVVANLDEAQHVIALDLPANGHSQRSPEIDATTAGLAEIIFAFLNELALEKPILIGHSHGGLLALRMAVSHPTSLSRLVLLAPAHPFDGYRENVVRFYLRPFGYHAARMIFPHIPAWLYLFFFRQMPGTRDHFTYETLEPYLHSLRMKGTVPYTLQVLKSWHDDMAELRTDIETRPVEVPTLMIWGKKDLVVPPATAPALLKHFTSATLVLMEVAGHLPNEENPQGCADLVQRWLNQGSTRVPLFTSETMEVLQNSVSSRAPKN